MEDRIQYDIFMWLQANDYYAFSVPNEGAGKGQVQRMMKLKSMGLRSGVSDLIVVLPNKVVFLEVKAEKGKQSEAQKRFEEKVKSLGHDYFVVHSIEETMEVLNVRKM